MSDTQAVNKIYIKDPKVREAFVKVKMYRIFAYIFFFVGILIFLMLYNGYMEGRPFKEVLSFAMIFIIIIPFLPAAVLSAIALRAEKDAKQSLEEYFEEEERKKEEQEKAKKEKAEMLLRKRAEAQGLDPDEVVEAVKDMKEKEAEEKEESDDAEKASEDK